MRHVWHIIYMHLKHVLGEQLGSSESSYSVHGAFGIHGFQILEEPELFNLVGGFNSLEEYVRLDYHPN